MALLTNAANYLTTPTHDGSGQVVHPSVIDFLLEHDMASWAGYRYWMAITPFPGGSDVHEDPNVLASHDGLTWVIPSGMVNPLDDALGGGLPGGFNNDPEVVYNPDTNELWVYYAYGQTDTIQERLVKVSEDMSYTAPLVVVEIAPWTQADNKKRSPAIWRESATRWHMWGGGGSTTEPYNIYYSFSTDGINWGEFIQCLNSAGIDPFQAWGNGQYNWHFSAKPNYKENRIEFFSLVHNGVTGIYYAQCSMEQPTVINTPIATPILIGSSGDWDAYLYRTSFVIENDTINEQYIYHVWYTGHSAEAVWHIGYTSGIIGTAYSGHKTFRKSMRGGGAMNYFGLLGAEKKERVSVWDNFNRANSDTALGNALTGQTWESTVGTVGVLNNRAYPVTFSSAVAMREINTGKTDFCIQADVIWATGGSLGIAFRGDTTNDNRMTFTISNSPSVQLNKKIATVTTNLFTSALIEAIDGQVFKLKLVVKGNNFKGYVDGSLVYDITDDNVLKTNTYHGIIFAQVTTIIIDNFRITY